MEGRRGRPNSGPRIIVYIPPLKKLGSYQDSSLESQPLKILKNISHGRSSVHWISKVYPAPKRLDIFETFKGVYKKRSLEKEINLFL